MSDTAPEVEHLRRVRARLRILQHYEVVTHNVSPDVPLLWHLPQQVLFLEGRYGKFSLGGLREYRRGPKVSPFRVPPPLEALILRLREERRYGVRRLQCPPRSVANISTLRRQAPPAWPPDPDVICQA